MNLAGLPGLSSMRSITVMELSFNRRYTMGIVVLLFVFLVIYFVLGVVANVTKPYMGTPKRRRNRRRKKW